MLTLSFDIKPLDKRLNIMVNEDQVIGNTLLVLEGKGLVRPGAVSVRSGRGGERINPRLTYRQARIYTGDILSVSGVAGDGRDEG